MVVCVRGQFDKGECCRQSVSFAKLISHASNRGMCGEILPEIGLKVPRLEGNVWIPVVPNIERCAALQIRHMRLWRRCQRKRGIQD